MWPKGFEIVQSEEHDPMFFGRLMFSEGRQIIFISPDGSNVDVIRTWASLDDALAPECLNMMNEDSLVKWAKRLRVSPLFFFDDEDAEFAKRVIPLVGRFYRRGEQPMDWAGAVYDLYHKGGLHNADFRWVRDVPDFNDDKEKHQKGKSDDWCESFVQAAIMGCTYEEAQEYANCENPDERDEKADEMADKYGAGDQQGSYSPTDDEVEENDTGGPMRIEDIPIEEGPKRWFRMEESEDGKKFVPAKRVEGTPDPTKVVSRIEVAGKRYLQWADGNGINYSFPEEDVVWVAGRPVHQPQDSK